MFGTMVIQLPSNYDGGVLHVCHRGEEVTFDFSGLNGMTRFHYAAFYADCQHELCEVTRGYRMCLVYNLVYSGSGAPPVPIDNGQFVDKVVAGIQDWEQDDNGLPVMAYMLSHRYCEASLSFQLLKNADRAIAEVLVEANKQKGFCLYLGTVVLHRVCSGDSCSPNMLIYEVEDTLSTYNLVSPFSGIPFSIDLDKNAIVPDDVFENVEPVNVEFESTGNEGATMEKIYHQAALLVWPKNHRMMVMCVDVLIRELESACKKLVTPSCDSGVQQQQQECEVLAKEIVAASKNSHKHPSSETVVTFLSCLQQLKAATLTSEFLQAIVVDSTTCRYLLYPSFLEAVVKSCIAFGCEQLERGLVVLFKCVAAKDVEQSCIFLSMLADRCVSSQQIKVCQKLVDIVCHVLASEEDLNTPSVHASASWSYYSKSQSRSKKFVCQLFQAFSALQCEEQLEVVLQTFFKQPDRYPLSTTLVPAAVELHRHIDEGSHAPLHSLLSYCVNSLQCSTQKDVGTPTWSNDSNLKCSCELCTVLAALNS